MKNKVRPRMGSNVRIRFVCYKQMGFEICVMRFDCISTPKVWHYYPGMCGAPAPHKKEKEEQIALQNPEAGGIINYKPSESQIKQIKGFH